MRLRRPRLAAVLALNLVFCLGTTGIATAADPPTLWEEPLFEGKLVNGPAAEAALAAMPNTEDAGDISAAVVTYTVTARVAADEEWRSYYGTSWQNVASNRVNTADAALYDYWGINFVIEQYVIWTSNPSGTRDLCGSIYPEFVTDVPLSGRDVAIGFVKNASTGAAGCAQGDKFIVKFQSPSNDWKVARHEMAHLFGNDHASGAAHPNDIMENLYEYPDTWCDIQPWYHYRQMDENADRYS